MANRQVGFTPAGSTMPPYINACENDDGSVTMTIRAKTAEGAFTAPLAQIELSREDFDSFLRDLRDAFEAA